jgi:hypothetical protein
MVEYLNNLLRDGDTFTLSLFMPEDNQLLRCGVHAVDSVGLVVADSEGELRAVPWASVNQCLIEVSDSQD